MNSFVLEMTLVRLTSAAHDKEPDVSLNDKQLILNYSNSHWIYADFHVCLICSGRRYHQCFFFFPLSSTHHLQMYFIRVRVALIQRFRPLVSKSNMSENLCPIFSPTFIVSSSSRPVSLMQSKWIIKSPHQFWRRWLIVWYFVRVWKAL